MSSPTASIRYHSLDALRAFALLLGIVYHAAESFMAGHIDWAIVDRYPSEFLALFRHASHSFRLEIFFLIAGFFGHLVYHRRGFKIFAWNRFNRILIPFVVGWCFIFPMCVYVWVTGKSMTGSLGTLDIPPDMQSLPPWQLTLGYFFSLQFLNEGFEMAHLWFLHQLMVLYVLVIGLRFVILKLLENSLSLGKRIDSGLHFIMTSRWNILYFILPTLFCLWFMQNWNVDTPRKSIVPHVPTTLLYGFFFTVGWLLHRQDHLLKEFTRRWVMHFGIGIILVLFTFYYSDIGRMLGIGNEHPYAIKFLYHTAYALMMWCFVFGSTGFFLKTFEHYKPLVRYIADSSYWLYLIHIPIVVYIQVLVAPIDLPWIIKFLLINLVAFPLLFLSYHFLVRSTFIGRQLNGRTFPFQLWIGSAAPQIAEEERPS